MTLQGRLLTTKEAALYLGVAHGTLRNWRATGRANLPFMKIGTHLIRYLVDDLDKWILEHRMGHKNGNP